MNEENIDFATHDGRELSFFVAGIPAPGGSKRFVGMSKAGRGILIDAAGKRNKDWRASVAYAASMLGTDKLMDGPLKVDFAFVLPRPKSHFHTSKKKAGQLREDAPLWHTSKPDTTKLIRSTEDALKGILWPDDSAIAWQIGSKQYGDKPGCVITVRRLAESMREVLP